MKCKLKGRDFKCAGGLMNSGLEGSLVKSMIELEGWLTAGNRLLGR